MCEVDPTDRTCMQVLRVLQAAAELVTLLKGAEAAMASLGGMHRSPINGRHESSPHTDLGPFLADQSQEWAAAACACLDTYAPLSVNTACATVPNLLLA